MPSVNDDDIPNDKLEDGDEIPTCPSQLAEMVSDALVEGRDLFARGEHPSAVIKLRSAFDLSWALLNLKRRSLENGPKEEGWREYSVFCLAVAINYGAILTACEQPQEALQGMIRAQSLTGFVQGAVKQEKRGSSESDSGCRSCGQTFESTSLTGEMLEALPGHLFFNMGLANESTNQFEAAILSYQKAMLVYRETEMEDRVNKIAIRIAECHARLGDYNVAASSLQPLTVGAKIDRFFSAESFAQTLGLYLRQATLFLEASMERDCLRTCDDAVARLTSRETLVAIQSESNPETLEIIFKRCNALALIYLDCRESAKGVTVLKIARQISDTAAKAGSKLVVEHQGVVLQNLGVAHILLRNYSKAIPLLDEAATINGRLNRRSHQSQCLFNLGFCLTRAEEYQQAIETFLHAYQASKEAGDVAGEWRALEATGAAYAAVGYNTMAARYFQKSAATIETNPDSSKLKEQREAIKRLYARLSALATTPQQTIANGAAVAIIRDVDGATATAVSKRSSRSSRRSRTREKTVNGTGKRRNAGLNRSKKLNRVPRQFETVVQGLQYDSDLYDSEEEFSDEYDDESDDDDDLVANLAERNAGGATRDTDSEQLSEMVQEMQKIQDGCETGQGLSTIGGRGVVTSTADSVQPFNETYLTPLSEPTAGPSRSNDSPEILYATVNTLQPPSARSLNSSKSSCSGSSIGGRRTPAKSVKVNDDGTSRDTSPIYETLNRNNLNTSRVKMAKNESPSPPPPLPPPKPPRRHGAALVDGSASSRTTPSPSAPTSSDHQDIESQRRESSPPPRVRISDGAGETRKGSSTHREIDRNRESFRPRGIEGIGDRDDIDERKERGDREDIDERKERGYRSGRRSSSSSEESSEDDEREDSNYRARQIRNGDDRPYRDPNSYNQSNSYLSDRWNPQDHHGRVASNSMSEANQNTHQNSNNNAHLINVPQQKSKLCTIS